MPTKEEIGRAKCREKTTQGNCFEGKRAAKKAAENWRKKTGDDIQFFRCLFCPHYHLGQRRTPQERAARARGD